MDSEIFSYIAAGTAVLSTAGGLLAARAAFLSAEIARDAVRQVEEAERRQLTRTAKASAQRICTEYKRAVGHAERLKLAYKDLLEFSGQSGGENPHLDEIDKKCNALVDLERNASEFLASGKTRRYSEDELADLLAGFSTNLSDLMVAKEQFRDKLVSVEQQNTMFRERQLSK